MIKDDVRLKLANEITYDDIARMSEMITHYVVGRDGENQPYYRPYNRNSARIMAIAICMVTGYEIEEGEEVYDTIMNDADIAACVKNATGLAQYKDILASVDSMTDDMIDFEKESVIHNSAATNKLVMEILTMQKQFEELRLEVAKNQNRLLTQQIDSAMKSQEAIDNLPPETVTKLMQKFADDEYDLEQLGANIVNEYLKSEYHKELEKKEDNMTS